MRPVNLIMRLPPPPLTEVRESIEAASAAHDHLGVLSWDWCLEELLENQEDVNVCDVLLLFTHANLWCCLDLKNAAGGGHGRDGPASGRTEDRSQDEHGREYIRLEERRVDILEKMGSFRESARCVYSVGLGGVGCLWCRV